MLTISQSHWGIGAEGVRAFAHYMGALKSLRRLDLGENSIRDEGMKAFTEGFSAPFPFPYVSPTS